MVVTLMRPTAWQRSSMAAYGPFRDHAEAGPLIARAHVDGAASVVVMPLNRDVEPHRVQL